MKNKWNDFPNKIPSKSPTNVTVRTAIFYSNARQVLTEETPAVFVMEGRIGKFLDADGMYIIDVAQWKRRKQ